MNKKRVYYVSIIIFFLIVVLLFFTDLSGFIKNKEIVPPSTSVGTSNETISESINEFFDRTGCKESTDGCFVCRRSDSGEISCSTAGFACIQKELVCKSK